MILPADSDDFAALRAGKTPAGVVDMPASPVAEPAVLDMLGALAATISGEFTPPAWLIVEHGRLVGLCSLVKLPAGREATIGYGIAADCRGGGAATRAVGALVAWAQADPRLDRLLAETGVDNRASQGVLRRNGFVQDGTRNDEEDGALLCWRLETRG
jgi:RimJ/RimL family protein N-acetyltransferase